MNRDQALKYLRSYIKKLDDQKTIDAIEILIGVARTETMRRKGVEDTVNRLRKECENLKVTWKPYTSISQLQVTKTPIIRWRSPRGYHPHEYAIGRMPYGTEKWIFDKEIPADIPKDYINV